MNLGTGKGRKKKLSKPSKLLKLLFFIYYMMPNITQLQKSIDYLMFSSLENNLKVKNLKLSLKKIENSLESKLITFLCPILQKIA
jgi:hypothetical protein